MRKNLLRMYHDLKESASESDFPYLLANTMHKVLLARFNGWPSPWRKYCLVSSLSDFRAADRVILSEAPDLDEIAADGHYTDAEFSDSKYSIQLKTFGKTFTVGRRAIINDDLNGIMQMPKMFGRGTVRTMVKKILSLLKGAALAQDGATLFALRTAATRNYNANVALANTAAGMAAVAACMKQIQTQVDPSTGELLGLTPKYLLTGTTLSPAAQQLLKSAQLLPVSTNGGGTYNPVAMLEHIEEPLLDSQVSSSFWAVLADPQDCPVIEVGFLDGKAEPDILVEKPTMVSVAGGAEDPYGYEFDELKFKVRHDWAAQIGMYQGISRGSS